MLLILFVVSADTDSKVVYFEKVRTLEGKRKTPKRESNEMAYPNGFPLENR